MEVVPLFQNGRQGAEIVRTGARGQKRVRTDGKGRAAKLWTGPEAVVAARQADSATDKGDHVGQNAVLHVQSRVAIIRGAVGYKIDAVAGQMLHRALVQIPAEAGADVGKQEISRVEDLRRRARRSVGAHGRLAADEVRMAQVMGIRSALEVEHQPPLGMPEAQVLETHAVRINPEHRITIVSAGGIAGGHELAHGAVIDTGEECRPIRSRPAHHTATDVKAAGRIVLGYRPALDGQVLNVDRSADVIGQITGQRDGGLRGQQHPVQDNPGGFRQGATRESPRVQRNQRERAGNSGRSQARLRQDTPNACKSRRGDGFQACLVVGRQRVEQRLKSAILDGLEQQAAAVLLATSFPTGTPEASGSASAAKARPGTICISPNPSH